MCGLRRWRGRRRVHRKPVHRKAAFWLPLQFRSVIVEWTILVDRINSEDLSRGGPSASNSPFALVILNAVKDLRLPFVTSEWMVIHPQSPKRLSIVSAAKNPRLFLKS